MRLIDTHCHVQMSEYDGDRAAIIQSCLDQEIGLIIVGTTLTDSVEAVRLAEEYPDSPVFAAVGVHPTDGDLGEVHPAQLAALLGHPKAVALGETGLDFFRLDPDDLETRQLQADVLEQSLIVATQNNKPVILHTRDRNDVFDAYDQTATILTRLQFKNFVMHCYSADWEHAQRFLDLGGYLSFTGILTFPKSETIKAVVKQVPLDRILIETDAPFLTPVPNRGKRNEPKMVALVADAIAQIRGISIEEVAEATTANAQRFFNLPA